MSLPKVVEYFALANDRSILPVTIDKVGMIKWKELQDHRLSVSELEAYSDAPAWAHITGSISGIFTLDIDPTGMEWAKKRGLEPLAHRSTPSGGLHIDIVLPDWTVKNTVGALAPGVDTRGEGGIALIYGRSRKGEYRWLRPAPTSPIKFEELPEVVVALLAEKARRIEHTIEIDFSEPALTDQGVQDLLSRALARAPLEGRNPMGFWLACRLRDGKLDKESARQIGYLYVNRVWDTNTHGSREPYTQHHFDASLDNAYLRMPS